MSRPPCICAGRGAKCGAAACELAPAGAPFDAATMCRPCWLFHNDPVFHELWAGRQAPPSLWERATTFAGAVDGHGPGGMKHVSEEEYERRLSICRACPHYLDNLCTRCGCKLAGQLLSKARWQAMHCPLVPPKW